MASYSLEELIEPVQALAIQAGNAILNIYEDAQDQIIEVKRDGSPLTKADQLAHEMIIQQLFELTPDIPILSEESTEIPYSERVAWERYWLVDPLDGTKEFLQRTGEFTVNIALIEKQHSVLGVVYAPVSGDCYYAARQVGAFKQTAQAEKIVLQVTQELPAKMRIVASRLHGQAQLTELLEKIAVYEIKYIGSSLKLCLIAEGKADIYPRLGTTSEWDTAAAQCIVEQAGGTVIDLYGFPLHYNATDSLQNPHFLVIGDKGYPWLDFFPKD